MGRIFTACLLFGLLLAQPVRAQAVRALPIEIEVPSTYAAWEGNGDAVSSIVSDGENRVWAIFFGGGTRLGLYKDGHWSIVIPAGLPPNLKPLQIVCLSDGSIGCLWQEAGNDAVHLLSRHTLSSHQLLARSPSKLEQPKLTALADGGMIVTSAGRELLCISRKGAQAEHITLQEHAFLQPEKYDDGSTPTNFAQIQAVQDQRGTIWLWSPAMKNREYHWRLRGLWRIKGSELTPQKISNVAPEESISVVAPWKDNQLAIAVAGVGLYLLDVEKHVLNTFKETNDELKYIERAFMLQDECFLITTPKPTWSDSKMSEIFRGTEIASTEKFYDPQKRTSALFHLDGHTMVPLTWKLDVEPCFGWHDRPVLAASGGFWTCVEDGLAFVSAGKNKTVQPMDWRNGLDLSRPMALARQGDSHLIVLNRYTWQTRLLPLNTPPSPPAALRVEMLETASLLLEDDRGRVWGRMLDDTFQCWENGRWGVVKVPEALRQMYHFAFLSDGHDQGWLIPVNDGSADTAAVCDFKTGEWTVFDSFHSALNARMHPASRLISRDRPTIAPVSSSGTPSRIGYLRDTGALHYFDGTRWREWQVAGIAGPDTRVTGPPAFDAQQRFNLPLNFTKWRFSPQEKWQSDDEESRDEEDIYHDKDVSPPPGCSVTNVTSTAYDRHGVCWLRDKKGRFWKSIHGCSVPVLQPDEPCPPLTGSFVYEVRSDLDGNAFLRMVDYSDGIQYLTIRGRLPLPESLATLEKVQADTARITFGPAAWHTCRVDGGEWLQATDQKEHTLTGLLPGPHELEVLAYNADLTPAKVSVKLKVTIEAAAIAEMNALIQKLGGDDLDASETAARRLRSQGRGILPSLKKARETASDSTRWWLDAVIQHIESPPSAQRAASAGASPLLPSVDLR